MRIIKSFFQRTVWLSALLSGVTVGFAQDELPPVPSFVPQGSTSDALPSLPGLDVAPAPAAQQSASTTDSSKMSPEQLANQRFQENCRKPFVGQIQGQWPPSFNKSRSTGSQLAYANPQAPAVTQPTPSLPDIPPLPGSEPEPASVNPPVANGPVVNPPRPPMNPYPASPDRSASPAPQNPPYSSPVIAPVQPPTAPMNSQPAPAQVKYMFNGGSICPLNIRPAQPGEHPMAALIPWATEGLQAFNSKIKDYSCVMIKRERIDGQLQESSTLYMKIREQPFSIYVKYLKPDRRAGVEALYRKGYHNDQLLGHDVGFRAMAGSLWLDPNGRLAMAGQKYPITDGGIPNLVRKMMDTVRLDMKNDPQGKETFVKFVENGGEIDGRPCIRVDVMHPVRRSCYRFHRAEIYLDKEWGIPVRYAAWMWPAYQGGKPVLDEEFTYTKLQFNRGFTDWDFSEKNREYKF